jgi:hypothetical protein
MHQWPEHYPEKCPPLDAAPADGPIYRLVRGEAPQEGDFQSQYEKQPKREWGALACQARGLSVFESEEACQDMAAIIPALRKKRIASGIVPSGSGVMASTPSNNSDDHCTLWSLAAATNMATWFTVVSGIGIANA